LGGGKHIGGELRARADADEMHVGDLALELFAIQRPRQRFHIGVARRLQHLEG